MSFAQEVAAAQTPKPQNIGAANESQASTTSGGGLGIEQQVIDASSGDQAQSGGGELEGRVAALEQRATAQPQVKKNQITPSPINPSVLGGFDPKKLTGVPNPTQSFDNTMPRSQSLAELTLAAMMGGQYNHSQMPGLEGISPNTLGGSAFAKKKM